MYNFLQEKIFSRQLEANFWATKQNLLSTRKTHKSSASMLWRLATIEALVCNTAMTSYTFIQVYNWTNKLNACFAFPILQLKYLGKNKKNNLYWIKSKCMFYHDWMMWEIILWWPPVAAPHSEAAGQWVQWPGSRSLYITTFAGYRRNKYYHIYNLNQSHPYIQHLCHYSLIFSLFIGNPVPIFRKWFSPNSISM